MKYSVAIALVIVSLAAAESPSFRTFSRQQQQRQQQAYAPAGYQPQGAAFSLPQRQRSQPQQTYGAPLPSYGPPPAEEPLSTEQYEAATGEPDAEPLAENLRSQPRKAAKLSELDDNRGGAYFVVVPQSQNYVVVEKSAPLVAVPATPAKVLPAKLISTPAPAPVAQLRAVPVTGYSSVITPFASYIQIE